MLCISKKIILPHAVKHASSKMRYLQSLNDFMQVSSAVYTINRSPVFSNSESKLYSSQIHSKGNFFITVQIHGFLGPKTQEKNPIHLHLKNWYNKK